MELKLYFATNRNHEGKDRFHPRRYGTKFSQDGMENLRFGVVTVDTKESEVNKHLTRKMQDLGTGDGEQLSGYLAKRAKSARIEAYPEVLTDKIHEVSQTDVQLGSQAMFADLKAVMMQSSDVLIYIHGFNVSWEQAVGSALALQQMLGSAHGKDPGQEVAVVLFTWPSDGLALPWVSYKSDRSEAAGSGAAVGRAFLKLRDFLANLRDRAKNSGEPLCGQNIHLLCHSMGNYLLQHALARVGDFTPGNGNTLPRLFEHIFLCAPDVNDHALEEGQPMAAAAEIARHVTVYHNRGDTALVISDYTKGNPERLGGAGAARSALLHNKIHQVDCTPVVHGLVEHSYYLCGNVNTDIRFSIDGKTQDDASRSWRQVTNQRNVWTM
jgi:esterase/lipase superfamily enzyme